MRRVRFRGDDVRVRAPQPKQRRVDDAEIGLEPALFFSGKSREAAPVKPMYNIPLLAQLHPSFFPEFEINLLTTTSFPSERLPILFSFFEALCFSDEFLVEKCVVATVGEVESYRIDLHGLFVIGCWVSLPNPSGPHIHFPTPCNLWVSTRRADWCLSGAI